MPTVDERNRLASWEQIEHEREKNRKRDEQLTQREQELSSRPPLRDIAWEKTIQAREDQAKHDQATSDQLAKDLDNERKRLKTLQEHADATLDKATQALDEAQDTLVRSSKAFDDAKAMRDEAVAQRKTNEEAARTLQLRYTAWDDQKKVVEAAHVELERDCAQRAADRQAELDALQLALNKQRDEQQATADAQADLQRLLELERTPELDRRETDVSKRESVALRATQDAKALLDKAHALSEDQSKEAKRLTAMEDGLESRTRLVERREAEAERKRIDAENVLRTAKAKDGTPA